MSLKNFNILCQNKNFDQNVDKRKNHVLNKPA